MSQDPTPYRTPAALVAPVAAQPAAGVPLAHRVGAFVLMANAVFALVEALLGVATVSGRQPGLTAGSAIVDVVLAYALVRGSTRVRTWILARVVVGVFFTLVTNAALHDWFSLAAQLAYSLALFGLFVGRAGRARFVASLVLVGLCFFCEGLGLLVLTGGLDRPLASLSAMSPEYVHPTPAEVRGVHGRYRLPLPPGWVAHTQAAVHAANPIHDQWISHPANDAHIMVIAETIRPDQSSSASLLLQTMIEHTQRAGGDARELRRGTLEGHPSVPLAEVEVTLPAADGAPARRVHYRLAAFMEGPQMVQLIGIVAAAGTARARGLLTDAMRGFELLPTEGLPGNEGGADGQGHVSAVPGGELRGREFDYTLRVAPGWYLRNQVEAAADAPTIDRWVVLPYTGASLYVEGERVAPGREFRHELHVSSIRQVLSPGVTLWRGEDAVAFAAGRGTLLRYDATEGGVTRRWIVGLLTTPTVAYRVFGSCAPARYDELEGAMLEMIRSFTVGGAGPAR